MTGLVNVGMHWKGTPTAQRVQNHPSPRSVQCRCACRNRCGWSRMLLGSICCQSRQKNLVLVPELTIMAHLKSRIFAAAHLLLNYCRSMPEGLSPVSACCVSLFSSTRLQMAHTFYKSVTQPVEAFETFLMYLKRAPLLNLGGGAVQDCRRCAHSSSEISGALTVRRSMLSSIRSPFFSCNHDGRGEDAFALDVENTSQV